MLSSCPGWSSIFEHSRQADVRPRPPARSSGPLRVWLRPSNLQPMAKITEDQRHIHSGGYCFTECSMGRHYSPGLPAASQSRASKRSEGMGTSPALPH